MSKKLQQPTKPQHDAKLPVIRSVCKKCKAKNTIRWVEREGYVCQKCDCTYLFAN